MNIHIITSKVNALDLERTAKEIEIQKNNIVNFRRDYKAQKNINIQNTLRTVVDAANQELKKNRRDLKAMQSVCTDYQWLYNYKGLEVSGNMNFDKRFLHADDRKYLIKQIRKSISEARQERRLSIFKVRILEDVRGSKQGHVWTEPGIFLRAYKAKLSTKIFKSKKPTSKKNHIGVEIEFYTDDNNSSKDIAKLFAEANLTDNVTLKDDGSIRCEDYENSHEVAIIDREDRIQETIAKVCEVLSSIDAKVNSTCGLHIHLDARNRNPELIFKRLLNAQKYLFQLVPSSRRNNTYCRPAELTHSFEASERYYAINPAAYKKFKTIEVRLHSGTVNATKISRWIELLLHVINHGIVKGKPKLSCWLKSLGCSKNLIEFYTDRAKKFSTSSNEPEHEDLPSERDDDNSCGDCGEDSGMCSECDRCHSCGQAA